MTVDRSALRFFRISKQKNSIEDLAFKKRANDFQTTTHIRVYGVIAKFLVHEGSVFL